MILREFPNLQWLKAQAQNGFADRKTMQGTPIPHPGWPTVILNTETKRCYRDNIRGPLSIFANLRGISAVETGPKRVVVHPDFYYVTNHDQQYSLEVSNPRGTEVCNVHFGEYWLDQVLATLVKRPGQLIDEGYFQAPLERFELHNCLHSKDPAFGLLLTKAKSAAHALEEEETLYELLVLLIKNDQDVRKAFQNLASSKPSTRQEISRRLIAAVDYIHSHYDKDLTLAELAAISCLSRFHFLRLFKDAFGKTPHQFINEVKIQRAIAALRNSSQDIRSISRSLGFRDSSTFGRLFRRTVGVYPSRFRN